MQKLQKFWSLFFGAAMLLLPFGAARAAFPSSSCAVTGLSFNPQNISAGQAATMSWATSGCTIVYVMNFGSNPPPQNPSLTFPQLLGFGTVLSNDKPTGSLSTGPLSGDTYFGVLATAGGQITLFYKKITVVGVVAPQDGSPYNTVINGTVYRVASGKRYPYSSAAAFLSYGFNSWTRLVPGGATEQDLPVAADASGKTSFVVPRSGSLVNDHGTIYLITGGKRQGFASAQAFLGLGYSFKNVLVGDTAFMDSLPPITTSSMAHPSGTIVNDHSTFYLMAGDLRQGIPSLAVFNSWGVQLREVVSANDFDRQIPAGEVLQARTNIQLGF